MFNSLAVIAIFCMYMGMLFALALWAERESLAGRSKVNNPYIYSLSLAVYCTTWTYYGSVGVAATGGMLFMTVYLGPTLGIIFWWTLLRKLVRLKASHHITSIADFISVRYEKSETLAAIATLVALLGNMPYIALQLKAIYSTFAIITSDEGMASAWVGTNVGPLIVLLMVVFTIIFGVRRLDPTERHEGMVMAVAAESLIKLVLFLAAGVSVVYFLFDGFGDLFGRLARAVDSGRLPALTQDNSAVKWTTYLLLSMNAILFLPRQFHIAVVENKSEKHIRQAMWLLPLYMLLINIFVYPIAMAGLLMGHPVNQADLYVLSLPLQNGDPWLALLVFIGGFSAATSMVLISSMTMATMITNDLLLPLVGRVRRLRFLERHLLECRWVAVLLYILLGYWFERRVGESLMLVHIGMIAFACMLQFAPAILGGIFWPGGNKAGAILGLSAGFLVWCYTSLVPNLVRGGWFTPELMQEGPWGVSWLRPEHLLGVSAIDPVSHTVLFSMICNLGLYVLGSLYFKPSQEGQSHAEEFVGALSSGAMFERTGRREAYIDLAAKRERVEKLLGRFFDRAKAAYMAQRCIQAVGLTGKGRITITELAEVYNEVEKYLAGSVGSAAAHKALGKAGLFSGRESQELGEVYAEILANLRARPQDLIRRIDFYQEREQLISAHASELEEKVLQLQDQILMRLQAEARLRESEERYRTAIESSNDGVAFIKDGRFFFFNKKFAEMFGYSRRAEIIDKPVSAIVHPDEKLPVMELSLARQEGRDVPRRYDFKGVRKDGTPLWVGVSATTTTFRGEAVVLAYVRDVTARRQAEEDIRNLSRRLIAGIEEERKRLAADLHDEFGQALTALHFGVQALEDTLSEDDPRRDRCRQLVEVIEGLADNIRKISSDLRPDMLDHLGLVSTMEWYVGDFRKRWPTLEVDFQAVGFAIKKRLDPRLEIVLYRLLQEGLNNVAKHAQAKQVSVKLTYSHPRVIFIIQDDGLGFKQETAPGLAGLGRGGVGLIGMRERVASVGGFIEIRSLPGKGTLIRAELPVEQPDAPGEE
ncbi:MAG: PAS domain S-box protein [Desulfarculus sp.]|nr:PAS domain S-box protein [Desulfarculus sp.]